MIFDLKKIDFFRFSYTGWAPYSRALSVKVRSGNVGWLVGWVGLFLPYPLGRVGYEYRFLSIFRC